MARDRRRGDAPHAGGLDPARLAQCGYCQPGQIMAAVAFVNDLLARQGGTGPVDVSDADLDGLRNVCRCGTYYRIRAAIRYYAQNL